MHIVTVGKEKNLDQLIEKRFPNLSPAELTRVRETTLKANVHLTANATLKPGMVIILPDATTSSSNKNNAKQTNAMEDLTDALALYLPQLTNALEAQRTELDQSAKLFKSAAFKKALDSASNETKLLAEQLEAQLKRDTETNNEETKNLPKEIDVVLKELSGLLKKLNF